MTDVWCGKKILRFSRKDRELALAYKWRFGYRGLPEGILGGLSNATVKDILEAHKRRKDDNIWENDNIWEIEYSHTSIIALLFGKSFKSKLEHINGDKFDWRRENLRVVGSVS
jgi:hypothetical protein